jgi:hypothetical protein
MAERPLPIILSIPTSAGGATPGATYVFFSGDYTPPRQPRATAQDVILNQNGISKYRYDNGPGPHAWAPFRLVLADELADYMPSATVLWEQLQLLWNYREGPMLMQAPDGVYSVDWAEGSDLERRFLIPKGAAGDKQAVEQVVTVQFEEG